MHTRVERKDVTVSVRVPETLKKLVEKTVERGLHINESDFTRDALREKIQRDAPSLYKELLGEAEEDG